MVILGYSIPGGFGVFFCQSALITLKGLTWDVLLLKMWLVSKKQLSEHDIDRLWVSIPSSPVWWQRISITMQFKFHQLRDFIKDLPPTWVSVSYTLTWICGFYRTFKSRGIRIAIPMSFITIWDLNPVWSILEKQANSNHTSKILVDLLQKNIFVIKDLFFPQRQWQKSAENESYRYALVRILCNDQIYSSHPCHL